MAKSTPSWALFPSVCELCKELNMVFGPINIIMTGQDIREGFLEEGTSEPLKESRPAEGNLRGTVVPKE